MHRSSGSPAENTHSPPIFDSCRSHEAYSIFTARAARRAAVANDMEAWHIIKIFAQGESAGTSVGENAVLVLKAKNR